MKQVSQNYKTGAIRLEDVHAPALRSGGALVETAFSVISAGTEGMKVREGKMSYIEKARARPDQVKKVVKAVQQQGLTAAYKKVMNKLDSLTPLGYSLAGHVTDVGAGAEEFTVGQRVACAGVGYANHAEINFVPKNLIVPVPANVPLDQAAFTTIGAIAMQGMRQAEMQLGETACVIGLGLIGQILVQLLRAGGIHVVGIDLVGERCGLAVEAGAAAAGSPDDANLQSVANRLTAGAGIDCIFLCAGGSSNKPVELAVAMARDRARVVDIGKTRLDLPWKDYYEKELDVRFSRSYGPGRYDPNYEERGVDYPIGYVRWTERRNMASFIDLLDTGRIDLAPLITSVHPFAEAESVYQDLAEGNLGGLGVLFEHAGDAKAVPPTPIETHPTAPTAGRVGLGVIGAGNYASSMLLPHLVKDPDARLLEVATATSLSARNAARKFGFDRTGTSYPDLLARDDVDAVLIATRHAAHPGMVAESLACGKAVFVEKPLAIDFEGAEQVRQAACDADNPRLLVGFNRRYAPLVREAAGVFSSATPLVMTYRVHAGQMDAGSWYLDASEGSRFVGEAGHFIDVFAYLTDASPVRVFAQSLHSTSTTLDDLDNVVVTITYEDGSIGNLLYLTQGGTKVPKEFLEISGGGQTVQLHNFEHVSVYAGDGARKIKGRGIDKGQREEMAAFVQAVKTGADMPISIDCLFETTLATLAAAESVKTGRAVNIADLWAAGS